MFDLLVCASLEFSLALLYRFCNFLELNYLIRVPLVVGRDTRTNLVRGI